MTRLVIDTPSSPAWEPGDRVEVRLIAPDIEHTVTGRLVAARSPAVPSPEPLNDGPVVDEPAATDSDSLERARALIETIHVASGDLATLYGPLWHRSVALRVARDAAVTEADNLRAALTGATPTAPHICANHDESLDEAYRKGLSDATPTAGAGGLAERGRFHDAAPTNRLALLLHEMWKHHGGADSLCLSTARGFAEEFAALAPVAHRPTPAEADR